MEHPMDHAPWDELDQLGQRLGVLKRLLDRAAEYGDHLQTQRIQAEIAQAKDRRHSILMSIAKLSVAA